MGSVSAYATAHGKRYRVRYRRPDSTQTDKRGFTTKRDAELFLSSVEVTKARGEFVDTSARSLSISAAGREWVDAREQVMKASSFRSLESSWRLHVLPRWGRRSLASVRHTEIQQWVSEMATVQSASNVLRGHGILSGILESAVRDRRLSSNPARDIVLPKKGHKRKAYLTHLQVEMLAASSAEPALVRFLAYTGTRWGEATALRVRQVDLVRGRALIEENAVMVGASIVMGTPKSHKQRSIPLPPFVVHDLELRVRARTPEMFLFGNGIDPLPLSNSQAGWFAGAVRRAQNADATFPRVTPHDLRHTAASLAISAGANVKAVQRMLGHASAAVTLDVYSDLFDDDLDGVSLALDAARTVTLSTAPSDSI